MNENTQKAEGLPIPSLSPVDFLVKCATTEWLFMEFTIAGGTMAPEDLRAVVPPEVDSRKGLIISGRGPIWLHGFLAHHYHFLPWIASYDPRLGGIVIVSHTPGISVGTIIDVQL